ncbi:hypothetical protein K437DRAFT_237648 [Tilletiaria anomala UBC 951]|uniref:CHY-type domain-containing protein n=1 Tax=Tilletiaria anomala (strain ATCC 24038 / CBS 436.72 / UBC 951) TaxID=1037660 RepID=A0A066VQQ8_TILAU|nr:uncharacterized protein K437DRAFT_237648 [Tilletiaria anomala UBC 951]KDN42613.1 hypothetical protein K437DRAFT_237648 [Tilletiaria anomala UBC 951]
MCKHILNAQVSVRAPCCQKWYDCPQCHAEGQSHRLAKTVEMAFICKKCRKAFRKDMAVFEESDEYCPHCDNHYVIEAKTPTPVVGVEGEDARVDNRMIKDDRRKWDPRKDFFARDESAQESERIDEGGWQGALRDRAVAGTAGAPMGLQQEIAAQLESGGGAGALVDLNDDDLDWS